MSRELSFTDRTLSEQLVDLHVFTIPAELWKVHIHSAANQIINEAFSAGFVRVMPETTINQLRDDVETQLGFDTVPRDFVFLRHVGRCLARVRTKQEYQLKVKNFVPPLAYTPEIYVVDASVDRSLPSSGASSYRSFSRNSRNNGYHSHMNGHHSQRENGHHSHRENGGHLSQRDTYKDDPYGSRSPRSDRSEFNSHRRIPPIGPGGSHTISTQTDEEERRRLLEEMLSPETTAVPKKDSKVKAAIKSKGTRKPASNAKPSKKWPKNRREREEEERKRRELEEAERRRREEEERKREEEERRRREEEERRREEEERRKREEEERMRDEERRRREDEERRRREQEEEEERLRQEEEERRRREEERLRMDEEERKRREAEDEERRRRDAEDAERRKREEEERLRREEEERLRMEEEERNREAQSNNKHHNDKRYEEPSPDGYGSYDRHDKSNRGNGDVKKSEEERKAESQKYKQEKDGYESLLTGPDFENATPEEQRYLKELDELRRERREMESQREELVKRAKQLQNKNSHKRNAARDIWKKKYFEEKKKTPPLEEQSNKLRQELENLHRKIMATLEGSKDKNYRVVGGIKPSQQSNLKIQATRFQHDIEDLQRRTETVKMKLTAEMKLRNQAETELRALRADLTQKKINVSLMRNKPEDYHL